MTPTARTPKTTTRPPTRVAVGGRQPLSAAALASGRTQTARRRRSPARRPGPGHRRRPVADRRAGTAAGRRGRRQHRPPPGRPAAVRLPAHPGHPGRLRRRRRRRDRPRSDRRTGHLPLPGIGDQHFAHRAGRYRGVEGRMAAFFLFRTLLRLMRRWARGGCRGGQVRVVGRGSRRVLARGRRGVLVVAGGGVS